LIGERDITFVDSVDIDTKRVYFICNDSPAAKLLKQKKLEIPELHIIDASFTATPIVDDMVFPLGLSEIFRKTLVRGATSCIIATPIETVTLISLYPIARNLLLSGALKLEIESSPKMLDNDMIKRSESVIGNILGSIQKSFIGDVSCQVEYSTMSSCLRLKTEMDCPLSIDEIRRLYESVYDDHSFTFIVDNELSFREVCGTNKCFIYLSKPCASKLKINAVIDASLRGGAGEAVHAMNLLYGLAEQTGLNFKASYNAD
jgi:N-acetyl-gamma-glutamyl-phosphate reductase